MPALSKKFAERQNKKIEKISREVLDVLTDYEFPGNVRELENIMERAVTLSSGPSIELQHLATDLQQRRYQVHRRQSGISSPWRTMKKNISAGFCSRRTAIRPRRQRFWELTGCLCGAR